MNSEGALDVIQKDYRSEGFPERDVWFLGTLVQGSARCPELLGNRRRRLILPGVPLPQTLPSSWPIGLHDSLTGLIEWLSGWLSS